jgi:hypothetical protein
MKADPPPVTGVPRDYMIVLPGGWYRIPLQPGTRERAIGELLTRQFAGTGNVPQFKRQLRQLLAERAEAAWRAGGIELCLSLMTAGPLPLAASLVITLIPPPPGGPLPAEKVVAGGENTGRSAEKKELAAGTAVFTRPQPSSLDVHVQVPGSGAWLLLSFSTPVQALATPMLDLFTAIAETLRWAG